MTLEQQLAAVLAACKLKDDIMKEISTNATSAFEDSWCGELADEALAIQPNDTALMAWLGEPVAWTNPKHDYFERVTQTTVFGSHTIPLYSPKGLK